MTPEQLQTGLLALERLRGEIDDAVLDLAQSALRERIHLLHRGDVPEQRLRQATVLFVDVVGSTALGGKLEPEDIHLVMDTALARFTDIVDRHNGRVLQYAGDSLLAAFGTQEVRGNLHQLAPDGERQATGCRRQKGAEQGAERGAERGAKQHGLGTRFFQTKSLARLRHGRIGVAARLKKE